MPPLYHQPSPTPVCPKCRTPLASDLWNTESAAPCPACGVAVWVEVFPGLFRTATKADTGKNLATDQEAGCYFHPAKRAETACHGCGRFLCALCHIPLAGQPYCASCLESGQKKGKFAELQQHRILHDTIALNLAVLPVVLCWPISMVSAPIALFWVIRHWNTPTSIVPRSKLRLILAALFSVLTLTGWILFAITLLRS